MRHIRVISRRPSAAIALGDLPVDVLFLIDILNAFLLKKSQTTS